MVAETTNMAGPAGHPPLRKRFRIAGFDGGPVILLSLFVLALGGTTFLVMNREALTRETVTYLLLADLIYVLLLTGVIARKLWRLLAARRDHAAGSQLHLRLAGIFAAVAGAPTIIVAAFATLSVNVGIETWFSAQVGSVVRNSLITAQSYAQEHRRAIQGEVLDMANDLNRVGATGIPDAALIDLLRQQQRARRLPEAYLIDGSREILLRGDFSYTFTYDSPSEAQMAAARLGEVVVVEDQSNNELRALVYLNSFIDTFLYVTRPVDGDVLQLLDETQATVQLYNETEARRGQFLSVFALIYLGFALLVVTTAAWFGLWLAERLSRPIGALAAAAERVGDGDLDSRVPEENTGDEVALLSKVFNRMTAQLKHQRTDILRAKQDSEERRNFIETVLSGVSAGVLGLDRDGAIEMRNDAAHRMIGDGALPPGVWDVFETARTSVTGAAQGQVTVDLGEGPRAFLARVAARSSDDLAQGYVLTLDDLTALVSAQREAAWGDVARRIAHEIKNPLTPIQLSAERLRRKFGPMIGEERENFDHYADVIVRQAGDIRRMVDEFSKFARMPKPEAAPADLAKILRDGVLLQDAAHPEITYEMGGVEAPVAVHCDMGLISQALLNILKNAAEAIETKKETTEFEGRIEARIIEAEGRASITVADNGPGLPTSGAAELTEPYVTTRAKGTGLGLAIVKKIAEQHGGELTLDNVEGEGGEILGAMVTLTLPRATN